MLYGSLQASKDKRLRRMHILQYVGCILPGRVPRGAPVLLLLQGGRRSLLVRGSMQQSGFHILCALLNRSSIHTGSTWLRSLPLLLVVILAVPVFVGCFLPLRVAHECKEMGSWQSQRLLALTILLVCAWRLGRGPIRGSGEGMALVLAVGSASLSWALLALLGVVVYLESLKQTLSCMLSTQTSCQGWADRAIEFDWGFAPRVQESISDMHYFGPLAAFGVSGIWLCFALLRSVSRNTGRAEASSRGLVALDAEATPQNQEESRTGGRLGEVGEAAVAGAAEGCVWWRVGRRGPSPNVPLRFEAAATGVAFVLGCVHYMLVVLFYPTAAFLEDHRWLDWGFPLVALSFAAWTVQPALGAQSFVRRTLTAVLLVTGVLAILFSRYAVLPWDLVDSVLSLLGFVDIHARSLRSLAMGLCFVLLLTVGALLADERRRLSLPLSALTAIAWPLAAMAFASLDIDSRPPEGFWRPLEWKQYALQNSAIYALVAAFLASGFLLSLPPLNRLVRCGRACRRHSRITFPRGPAPSAR